MCNSPSVHFKPMARAALSEFLFCRRLQACRVMPVILKYAKLTVILRCHIIAISNPCMQRKWQA